MYGHTFKSIVSVDKYPPYVIPNSTHTRAMNEMSPKSETSAPTKRPRGALARNASRIDGIGPQTSSKVESMAAPMHAAHFSLATGRATADAEAAASAS